MSDKAIAAFKCKEVVNKEYGGQTVRFRAVRTEDGDDWEAFADATPSGSLEIGIDEDAGAYDYFEPGEIYYATFTPESGDHDMLMH
ncbi:MAG: hypothetical protein ABEN55_00520 [Bradymonadaceae bacterium]